MRMLVTLMLSQRTHRLCLLLFIFFSILCFVAVISTILSSWSLIPSFVSVILLLIPSGVLFISVHLFFSSSRSLVNISCIFSILDSILFLRSCIIFTIIILNSFSGKLPISTSFSCFSGVFILSLHLGHNFLLFHTD